MFPLHRDTSFQTILKFGFIELLYSFWKLDSFQEIQPSDSSRKDVLQSGILKNPPILTAKFLIFEKLTQNIEEDLVMIELKQNELAITIPALSPTETLFGLQSGLLEMVKTILLTGSEGEDVEIDRPTANGCVFALDLVKATLVDSEIQALSIGFAGEVKCFQSQVSQISGTILDVIPGDTAWIIEAERWPVGENMFEARLQTELEKPEGQLLTLSHNQIIELRGRFGGC